MTEEKPKAFTPLQLLIGGLLLGFALLWVGLYKFRDNAHHFAGSCDERAPTSRGNSCEDFYTDYFEYTCGTPILRKPCDRAHVIGGGRGKAAIRWYYDGSAGRAVEERGSKKTCDDGETWVGPEWQEREHF